MSCPALCFVLLLTLAGKAESEGPGPSAAHRYLESLDVRLVNVDVTVTDARGVPVTGLALEDFEVLDDGRPVEITHFAAPAEEQEGVAPGLRLVLFLDDAELVPAQREAVFHDLQEVLGRLLAVAREVMVVRRGETTRVEKAFTASRDALSGALFRLARVPSRIGSQLRREQALLSEIRQARGLPPPANGQATWVRTDRAENEAAETLAMVRQLARERRARTLSSLQALRGFLSALNAVEGRTVVLYVSAGIDTRPGERLFQTWLEKYGTTQVARRTGSVELESATYHLAAELEDLLATVRRSGISFYTLTPAESRALAEEVPSAGPRFRTTTRRERTGDLAEHDALRLLGEQSAGRFFPDLGALEPLVGKIESDERGRYSLGYPSPYAAARASDEASEHTVTVRLRHHAELRLRYPSRYRDDSSDERLLERAAAALLLDVAENPLGVEVEVTELDRGAEPGRTVSLELRVPMSKLVFLPEGDMHRSELSAFILTQDASGLISSARKLSAPIEIPNSQLVAAMSQFGALRSTLELGPGDRRIAVAVRDEVGGVEAALVFRIRAGTNPP